MRSIFHLQNLYQVTFANSIFKLPLTLLPSRSFAMAEYPQWWSNIPDLMDGDSPAFRVQQNGNSLPHFPDLVAMSTPLPGSHRAVSRRSRYVDDLPPMPAQDVSSYVGLSDDFPSPPSFIRLPEATPVTVRLRDFRVALPSSPVSPITVPFTAPEPEIVPEPIVHGGLRGLRLPNSPSDLPMAELPVAANTPVHHAGAATPPGTYDPSTPVQAAGAATAPPVLIPIQFADAYRTYDQVPYRFLTGYRTKQKLAYGDYLFNKSEEAIGSDKIYWSARCPVRIHTEDGEIVKVWYGAHGPQRIQLKAYTSTRQVKRLTSYNTNLAPVTNLTI